MTHPYPVNICIFNNTADPQQKSPLPTMPRSHLDVEIHHALLAGVVWVLVVVAIQYAARGNEDAGDALADHDQRHAAPFAEVHAREGGDVLGLAVHDAACRVCERPSKQVHGTGESWKGFGVARAVLS